LYNNLSFHVAHSSNVAAGRLFGIPLRGTHSHAFVSSYMVSFQLFNKKKLIYLENIYEDHFIELRSSFRL